MTISSRDADIRKYWDEFMNKGCLHEDSISQIRPVVYDSWIRSKSADVNPLTVKQDTLSNKELAEHLDARKLLMSTAGPYIEKLYSLVNESGFLVILCDEDGYIMEMTGDEDTIKKRTKNSNLTLGSNRSEAYAGTNAIGTCLFTKEPTQIYGNEHYVKTHHPFTCSAAPIHNENGEVIGCLDITGPIEKTHLHTLGMVVAAVDGIEKEMALRTLNQQLNSIFQSIKSGIIMIDESGTVINHNDKAEDLLRYHKGTLVGVDITELLSFANEKIDLLNLSSNIYDAEAFWESNNANINLSLSASPIKNEIGEQTGVVLFFSEIERLHKLITRTSGFNAIYSFDSIIGTSEPMKNLRKVGKIAAKSSSNVLILGESGTGKELVAQSIHNASDRYQNPFIALNCSSLPKTLIESELFGYEGGSFTGANKDGNPGKFELADGGTIFLDEIGDMALDLQTTFLRVLESKEITRIGGKRTKKVDVRIIAATNANLPEKVQNQTFRSDLFYRLNVFSINIIPLRERKEDIEELSNFLLNKCSNSLGKNVIRISETALDVLYNYSWPGNVRELENVIERAVNLTDTDKIDTYHLPRDIIDKVNSISSSNIGNSALVNPLINKEPESIKEMEKQLIINTLKKTSGNMKKSSEFLGFNRRTLYRKLEEFDIDIKKFR